MSLMEKEQQLSQLQEQLEQHQDDAARRIILVLFQLFLQL